MPKILINYTEETVKQYLDEWLPKSNVCQCDSCRMDVAAIMLNALPQHYVVTDSGALYAQLREFDLQHKADLMSAMTDAIRVVIDKPHHNRS